MNSGQLWASARVMAYSRVFGAPTALNQTGVPFVSKRSKLKVEHAFNCWKGPVRRSP